MNNIPVAQNEPKQIQRLAAQRYLYSTAKRVFGAQLILAGPMAIGLSLLLVVTPEMKVYAVFYGVFVSILDVFWLTPRQKQLREYAAKIQETFDCEVLQLPWNDFKVGKRVDPELVKEQAEEYAKKSGSLPPLTNWYAPIVGTLPLEVARIVCQRANCWWDSQQRRRYAGWVIAGVVFASISMLALGLIGGLTVEKLLLTVIAPLFPALILGIRQYSEQMEAAARLDKLKEHAERLWSDAFNHLATFDLLAKSRSLQDEIFENRKRSPLMFDWIFRRLRNDYEVQMNHGAQDFTEEAERRLGLR